MNSCKIKLELVKEFLWERGNTIESIVLLSKLHSKQNIEVELEMRNLI